MHYRPPPTGEAMSDSEIRRLEDRIDAVNREGQLRLDATMARIEARFQAIDARFDLVLSQLASLNDKVAASRTQFQWLAALILTVGLGLGGLIVGMKQVWVAGVQTGQVMQAAPPSGALAPDHT